MAYEKTSVDPHVVDPATGRTLWEQVRPHVESGDLQIGGAGLPGLPMGGGA